MQPAAPMETFARIQLPAIVDSSMLAAGWLLSASFLFMDFHKLLPSIYDAGGWLAGWLAGWLLLACLLFMDYRGF